MIYRVRLIGRSETGCYNGYMEVVADNEEEAAYQAKQRLNGFCGWSPSMFHVTKVERI